MIFVKSKIYGSNMSDARPGTLDSNVVGKLLKKHTFLSQHYASKIDLVPLWFCWWYICNVCNIIRICIWLWSKWIMHKKNDKYISNQLLLTIGHSIRVDFHNLLCRQTIQQYFVLVESLGSWFLAFDSVGRCDCAWFRKLCEENDFKIYIKWDNYR